MASRPALVTRWLLLACLLAAAAGLPVGRLAFLPVYAFGVAGFAGPVDGLAALRGLFSHLFVHDGPTHLFTNMAALLLFGPLAEARLGRRRMLALFFGGGIIAALTEGLLGPDRLAPLLGASGGLSALMGALAVLSPRAGWQASGLTLRLLWLTVTDGAINLGLALLSRSELAPLVEQAAWAAHLGGLAAGLLAGLAWRRSRSPAGDTALTAAGWGFAGAGRGTRILTAAIYLAALAAAGRPPA